MHQPASEAATPDARLPGTRSDRLHHQFARYLVAGGVGFVADFSCLYLLTEIAHLHYLVSAAIGFTIGLLVNYAISRFWVFSRRTIDNGAVEFAIFAAIGLVGLGLNEAILWTAQEVLNIHYLIAKLFSTGVVLFWNFGARKILLFR